MPPNAVLRPRSRKSFPATPIRSMPSPTSHEPRTGRPQRRSRLLLRRRPRPSNRWHLDEMSRVVAAVACGFTPRSVRGVAAGAEPEVRIHLPPADSPSLSRSHFRASRTRAFPAGVRGSLDDGVSRDAAGFPLRANRRQCLCRAIFQYRSAADAVSGNATTVRTKSGVSGL
jgi:hypothetical protein